MVKANFLSAPKIIFGETLHAALGDGSLRRAAFRLFGTELTPDKFSRKLLDKLPLGVSSYFSDQDNYNLALNASQNIYELLVEGKAEGLAESLAVVRKHGFVQTRDANLEEVLNRAVYRNNVKFVSEFLSPEAGGLKLLTRSVSSVSGPKYQSDNLGEHGFISSHCAPRIISDVLRKGSPEMLTAIARACTAPLMGNPEIRLDTSLHNALENEKHPEMAQHLIDISAKLAGRNVEKMVSNAMNIASDRENFSAIRLLKENFMPGGLNADRFTIDQKFADEILKAHVKARAGNISEILEMKPSSEAITAALQTALYNENDWLTHYSVPDVRDVRALIEAGADMEQARYSLERCFITNPSPLAKDKSNPERQNMLQIAEVFGMDEEQVLVDYMHGYAHSQRLYEEKAHEPDRAVASR